MLVGLFLAIERKFGQKMIKVQMWELVRDWVKPRYANVSVTSFRSENEKAANLGRIVLTVDSEEVEIGFIASKGILIWKPIALRGKKFDYDMFLAKDPQMFEKLEEMLKLYEAKRLK